MLNEKSAAAIFLALSQPPRIEIVRLLAGHPEGLSGVTIANLLEVRATTVSAQLLLLEQVGLVVKSARTKHTIHKLKPDIGKHLMEFVRQGFTAPEPPPDEAFSMRMAG